MMIDRRVVAQHFSRAAQSYDAAAILQKEVAFRLAERWPFVTMQPQQVMDLGTGTGFLAQHIQQYYPQTQLVAVDLSETMLKQCRSKLLPASTWWQKFNPFANSANAAFVNADAYQLPFADSSMDMLVSSLMLQWCDDLPKVLAECRRVLKPNGVLFMASLGPDTLKEIRLAWQAVDDERAEHTLNFADLHDLGDALSRVGFSDPVCDVEHITLTYANVTAALKDLKAIGATNASVQRQKGLMGKDKWHAFLAAYEAQAMSDGRIPATFEVVYAHAFIAGQKQSVEKALPQTATIPVSSIKRWQAE
jgi:malonyl-CoA O-methyltransferase